MNYLAQAHAAYLDPRFHGPEEIICHADYLCPKCESDKTYYKIVGFPAEDRDTLCGICGSSLLFVLIQD